jgi:hypothetical protein
MSGIKAGMTLSLNGESLAALFIIKATITHCEAYTRSTRSRSPPKDRMQSQRPWKKVATVNPDQTSSVFPLSFTLRQSKEVAEHPAVEGVTWNTQNRSQ